MSDNPYQYGVGLGQPGNLPNSQNTGRAMLERIEHKLDTIYAMLLAGSITAALPETKKTL